MIYEAWGGEGGEPDGGHFLVAEVVGVRAVYCVHVGGGDETVVHVGKDYLWVVEGFHHGSDSWIDGVDTLGCMVRYCLFPEGVNLTSLLAASRFTRSVETIIATLGIPSKQVFSRSQHYRNEEAT